MRLLNFKVTNYRCVDNSGEIEVDPKVTCLVGKNESGKTNLLQALRRVNPTDVATFDVTNDYPRRRLREYERGQAKDESAAVAVEAEFELQDADIEAVSEFLGSTNALPDKKLTVSRDYDNDLLISLAVNEAALVKFVLDKHEVGEAIDRRSTKTIEALLAALEPQKKEAKFAQAHKLASEIAEADPGIWVWNEVLEERCPGIMYFPDYQVMRGKATIQELSDENQLKQDEPLRILRDLLYLAGATPASLQNDANYEHHKANLEATANDISDAVFKYWKQNTNLEVEFDVHRPANNASPTFHVRIKNLKHRVTVTFDDRSRGFVWFFSFLTAFKRIAQDHERLIILLDEPGLNLHASAQADLLEFIEKELVAKGHQVIYTTHSPFMVEPHKLDRVRTVEDKADKGTTVSRNWASVDSATSFPLQAALGYDLAQTLFVGPNSLAVEGTSDMLYLQAMSALLEAEKRTGLDERWTITPVGGAGKLSTFVALLGSNNKLNIAVLMDYKKADEQHINEILDTGLIDKNKLVLYSKFAGKKEADVEDMFDAPSYLAFVKAAYPSANDIAEAKLGQHPRLAYNVAEYLKSKGLKEPFHFKPAQEAAKLLGDKVKPAKETLDRFEELFKHLNKLLKN